MSKIVNQQNVTVTGKDTEVIVRQRSGNRISGSFSAISPLTNKKRSGSHGMQQDIFDRLDHVSKAAFSVFNNLKYNRSEETNITQYVPEEELSQTQKETLSRKLAELKKVGLIRSLRKEVATGENFKLYVFKDPRKVFIINPDMIKCTDHAAAMEIWHQCGTKGK